MRGSSIFGVMALAAVTALPMAAQQHGQHRGAMGVQDSTAAAMHGMHGGMMPGGMMGMMGSMDGMGGMGMMASMPPGPGMILGAAEDLELTPDQRERLTALRDQTRSEHMQHMQAAMEEHQAAARALEQESPDLGAFEDHLRNAADHMVTLHAAMARDGLAARDILTEAQRAQLQEVASTMRHMHGGMGMMDPRPGGAPGPGR
ncbi:MAG TPA: Spy/CpxP family protein refolding chaperone [Longimicrobiales bacterium]|nr:Spy/CpxP family protein refolding chaperone [Longimicrobiales bacterium]